MRSWNDSAEGPEVPDTGRSWDEAVAAYEELAADGDPSAVFLLDVARRLAATAVGSFLEARAWEECLGIFAPDDTRPPRGTPWVAVVSEADEIDHCMAEYGESPAELDPRCWRVELRGIVHDPSAGDEERTLDAWRCFGGAAEVATVVEGLLPRLRQSRTSSMSP
jgi:hypothetical protein